MGEGFRSIPRGQIAAPPYTKGPYDFSEDISFNGNVRKSPGRYYLEEFFTKLPDANAALVIDPDADDATALAKFVVANRDFEILGTNADIADFSWDTVAGGVKMETGSADNDQLIILPHLDTKQTAWSGVLWGTENQVIWEATIRTGASVATRLIWAGLKLTNTPTIATDDDQVFFRYDTDVPDTNWQIISSIAGTDTTTDSGVALAALTEYQLRIEIDSDRKAHFYINNVEIYISSALTNDVDFIPYVGLQQLSSGDADMTLCYEKISRILYE